METTQAVARREVMKARGPQVLEAVKAVHEKGLTIHKSNLAHYISPEHCRNQKALTEEWNEYIRPLVEALPCELRETVRTKARVGALKAGQRPPTTVAQLLEGLNPPSAVRTFNQTNETEVEARILRNPQAFIDKMNAALFAQWAKIFKARTNAFAAEIAAQEARILQLKAEYADLAA